MSFSNYPYAGELHQDQLQSVRTVINTVMSGKVRRPRFIHKLRGPRFPRFSPRPTPDFR